MGVCGLCFFIVGYDLDRKFLVSNEPLNQHAASAMPRGSYGKGVAYLVAALCSLVWQNKNLTSFSPAANPYFVAIVSRKGIVLYRVVP
jgi:hypothetical protein